MAGPLSHSPGVFLEGEGVRFTLYSGCAEAVELCLFGAATDTRESRRVSLESLGGGMWTVHVPGASPGTLYGYRVHGPYQPKLGLRCNPSKVLVDPRAPALGRLPVWDDRLFGYARKHPETHPDSRDNADIAPLGRVTNPAFDWEDDSPPRVPWERTFIYETHVKSLTQCHPQVPEPLRGSFMGLASEPVLEHLRGLGVTTVELLPVHQKFDEWHCHKNGLTNYWGYSSLLYFAPDTRFARVHPEDPAREFKEMVKALHRAGLEVILDVVYNHTCEADYRGPTLCYRGIDNAAYYRLQPEDLKRYDDFTGCGHSWNSDHPAARQLVLDSLRFWVREMHVDGFRFDLAPVLGRGPDGFDRQHAFFREIENDPDLSRVKLIAEPWDLGPGGYQVAAFPAEWSEWNDQYRDWVRRFWMGEPGQVGPLARRLSGSEDIYGPQKRPPRATVNFITCHDGFTLTDLVSYRKKHNQANRENNRDGPSTNFSDNFGDEGPTLDARIREVRQRQKRNLVTTLLLSLGTPMLSGGDELGRSQWGNNNAWCQDNAISWYDWTLSPEDTAFLDYVKRVVAYRQDHPVFRRTVFFTGQPVRGERDIVWWHPEGREMTDVDWQDPELQTLGARLTTSGLDASGPPLLLIFHASQREAVDFVLPVPDLKQQWVTVFDTGHPESPYQPRSGQLKLGPMTVALLEQKSQ